MQLLKVACNDSSRMRHGLPRNISATEFRMILSLLMQCFVNLCFVLLIGARNRIIRLNDIQLTATIFLIIINTMSGSGDWIFKGYDEEMQ